MFVYKQNELKEIFDALKKKSNKKIYQKERLEAEHLRNQLKNTIDKIFEEAELEHIGNDEYSNKTHGEEIKEALLVKIEFKVIDEIDDIKLKINVYTRIGEFKKEFEITVLSQNSMYGIETIEGFKEINTTNMKDKLKEKLEIGFSEVKESI